MSSVAQRLMTAEEFWQSPMNDKHSELVRGEVVKLMPPNLRHGKIASRLSMLLGIWAEGSVGGYVGVEGGYILSRNPDTVRAPDVSYIRADRVPPDEALGSFGALAPDLAVEIVSPSETNATVREKVRDFLAAGTPLVWTVYPDTRDVVAHTPDGLARTYREGDILEHPDVLPGFSCKVAELFM
jgi:Uma2 family endonuclease